MPSFGPANTIQQLSAGGDGCVMGLSATDKIGFYGLATPIVQPATIAAVGTTAVTTTAPFGFGTSTQATAVLTSLNSVVAALIALGLIAAS